MRVVLAVALALLTGTGTAFAQQAQAGTSQQTFSTSASKVPEAPLQGFSVVLVIGDLQGTQATDDIPQAARKALTDMRDFLPYKSYKLLDATWVMCCAQIGRRVAIPGGPSLRESASVTQMLRGPEDQEYELQLRTHRIEGNRISVSFELNAAAGSPLSPLEKLTSGDARTPPRQAFHEKHKPVIDTVFTMDVGETVVVGTSRVKGGSRALIALLTAVPPRSGTGVRE